MNGNERNFLNDVKEALEDWEYSYDCYHEDGDFCIDITFDDFVVWDENSDEIWNALYEVCDDWGAGIDSDINIYYLCLEND